MSVEQGDQPVNIQRLGDIELMHEIGGAEKLQERAMHKGVAVRAHEAEDEVAPPQLLHNRSGRGAGLGEMQFLLQIALDQAGERRAVNQVPLQPAGSGLHVRGDAAEDVGLLPQADLGAHPRKVHQRALGVPLVQQHARPLGV